MAPITRLQEKPSLRIKYTAGSNAVRNRNSMIKPALAPTGGIVKKSTSSKKQKPKPKPRRDCVICANNRAPQSFKVLENIQTCAHLHDTCKMCVERLIKAKVTDRRLHDAVLACPFPECDVVLEFTAVEKIVSKRTFDLYVWDMNKRKDTANIYCSWDQALLKYHLGASDHFIACLNPVCSCHFSVEGWKEECKDKKKIACPYCDSKLCGSCNRLWHGGKDCDKAKDAEDEASEELIKAIGAKPCPSCGVNIEKIGGCDHMACTHYLSLFAVLKGEC